MAESVRKNLLRTFSIPPKLICTHSACISKSKVGHVQVKLRPWWCRNIKEQHRLPSTRHVPVKFAKKTFRNQDQNYQIIHFWLQLGISDRIYWCKKRENVLNSEKSMTNFPISANFRPKSKIFENLIFTRMELSSFIHLKNRAV
jgi:hypothetical protein